MDSHEIPSIMGKTLSHGGTSPQATWARPSGCGALMHFWRPSRRSGVSRSDLTFAPSTATRSGVEAAGARAIPPSAQATNERLTLTQDASLVSSLRIFCDTSERKLFWYVVVKCPCVG